MDDRILSFIFILEAFHTYFFHLIPLKSMYYIINIIVSSISRLNLHIPLLSVRTYVRSAEWRIKQNFQVCLLSY